eukprot:TRINITY_DN10401_c0_g2_i5.p3 TRINITY_DN10401_c0_g2~~TRINITY_DN10401_c0_g2_i5.p3  ORF type:complete len:101 (+),score=14.05 TRINITY_DN10401_c0_g2_i5:55-357(+)
MAPNPSSRLTGLKLKTGYQADKFTANTEVSQKGGHQCVVARNFTNLIVCPPIAVVANGVFGYGKFVFGAGTSFDLAKNTATGSKFSVGYTDGNMAVASSM